MIYKLTTKQIDVIISSDQISFNYISFQISDVHYNYWLCLLHLNTVEYDKYCISIYSVISNFLYIT